jgi:hypothetical protein
LWEEMEKIFLSKYEYYRKVCEDNMQKNGKSMEVEAHLITRIFSFDLKNFSRKFPQKIFPLPSQKIPQKIPQNQNPNHPNFQGKFQSKNRNF